MRRAAASNSPAFAPQRPRKLGKRERYQRHVARRERAEERHLARLHARFRATDPTRPVSIRLIPKHVWAMACAVLNDESGRAARIYLRRARNKVAVGCIRLAALVPVGQGRSLRSWADYRARAIAALGLSLLQLEVPTRRKGPWEGVVRGIPQGAFLALLSNAWKLERGSNGELRRRRPSRAALSGTHRRDADLQNGQQGWLRALELAGFCYAQQLPAKDVEPFERCWTSGYATNRYWIVTSIPTRPLSDEQKLELMALHEAGRLVESEQLELCRRRQLLPKAAHEPPAHAVRAAPS